MSILRPKSRLRLKTVRMPPHFFTPPEGAPPCYGNTEKRTIACQFAGCAFRGRCGDFVDRLDSEAARGIESGTGACFRAVLPAKAPIVVDEIRFRACIVSVTLGRRTPGERMLAAAVRGPETIPEVMIAQRAEEAHLGGLLSARAATEIATCGTWFFRWLLAQRWYGSRPKYAYSAALVWITAETTRQALRNQGRPEAFRSKAHHEFWGAMLTWDLQLSRNALRKRRKRVERLYARFETSVRSGI